MTADARIQVRQLQKNYGRTTVLHDVNLEVNAGEIVAFIGPNGSGKTTCLRSLVGLTRRNRGTVAVCGLDPNRQSVAVRRRCSYLPGETSVYRGMTGQQFLQFATGFFAGEIDGLRQRLQDGFGLPLRKRIRTYSAGMKQQLALCAALLPDVDVYLLDEADRALDVNHRMFLREQLQMLAERGKTILVSSHNLGEVQGLAQRMIFLLKGRTIPESTIATAQEKLRRRLRVALLPDTDLPQGATLLHTEHDGSMLFECDSDPAHWLAQIAPGKVLRAEIGLTRAEDLYLSLTESAR